MIYLEKTCKVTAVHKTSASAAFKKLDIGDLIHFSIPLNSVGRCSGRTRAAYITCKNLQTGVKSELSFNQIGRVIANFEWSEMNGNN
jgi:hypothetical protein